MAKNLPTKNLLIKNLLCVGLYQLIYLDTPPHAAINETVNAAKVLQEFWAVKLINGVLRSFTRDKIQILEKLQPTTLLEHPAWLTEMLQQAYPTQWQSIITTNNSMPSLTLRINPNYGKQLVIDELQAKNINYVESKMLDTCIYLDPKTDIKKLDAFQNGGFSVQDLSAQLASLILAPQNNDYILDACSAPGGKTCALLEAEPNVAQITALDIKDTRLQLVQQNLIRLKLPNKVQMFCCDVSNPRTWYSNPELPQFYDKILLDAPCSATGIIRRQPDVKVLRTSEDIQKLAQQQYDLLLAVWQTLKPGGKLLYATCSILPQENWLLIERFLQRNRDSKIVPINIAGLAGERLRELQQHNIITPSNNIGLQILPTPMNMEQATETMDGFYYALLEKSK
jgi:16S rRNA (cytosine967-C5)-methyltransferase